MTERKPFGVSWETWIDRQIREGMERGEFDGLPGHGKPIRRRRPARTTSSGGCATSCAARACRTCRPRSRSART